MAINASKAVATLMNDSKASDMIADEPVKYQADNLIVVTNPPTTNETTAAFIRERERMDEGEDDDCILKNTAILFCKYK